ncbi:MAG: hypothetical protein ACU0CX_11485 [Sagittula sp.]|uniref:hypothetical protein n=1 Tax=Sagittula sp. TaxID=2038081 RepID=UPI0040592EDB
MRPDPNALAQGMIRLLRTEVIPHMPPGTAAVAHRIATILRDTDWTGATDLARRESLRLRQAMSDLAARGVPTVPVPEPQPDPIAEAAALRAAIARTVPQLVGGHAPVAVRVLLAQALADCAEYGLQQTSAPHPQATAREENEQ